MKRIVIGKECWIANSSTIMPGAIIPDYSIIGSNSLVNKDFSSAGEFPLIAGIPAKVIAVGYTRIFHSKIEDMLIQYFYNHEKESYFFQDDDFRSILWGGEN